MSKQSNVLRPGQSIPASGQFVLVGSHGEKTGPEVTVDQAIRETTYEVRVPAELLTYGYQAQDIQRQFTEWLVLSLFKDEHISSGKAAKLLSITRLEFLSLLRRRGIPYLDYSEDELADELAAVDSLEIKRLL